MENHKDWRERLDQNEVPMDTEKFWDSLESKIPEVQTGKKKRRFFFWLLVFLIGSGVTVGGILFMRTNNETSKLASIDSQKTAFEKLGERERSINKSEKSKSETQEETTNAEILSQKNSFASTTNSSRSDQNLQNRKSANTGNKVVISSKSQAAKPEEIINVRQNAGSSFAENDLETIATASGAEETMTKEPENQNPLKSGNNLEALDNLPTLATELSTEPNWNFGSIPSFDNFQKIKTNKSGWQYWMDLSYGIGIAQHNFSTTDPFIQSYLDNRSKHESKLESRLAVWENRLIHPSGLYVSTGLRYYSHITRFDWSKEETKLEWKLADGFAQDGHGNQFLVRDSAWQPYRELREIRQHNTISTLDIPMNIGYIMRKSKFSFEFALGVTANIAQYSSGKQLNLQGQPVKWNDTEELSFKEFSTGFGASAMLRGSWYPTQFLGLFIQPSFHKDFSNRMIAEAGYSHKIDFISIQAGLSFLLFESER